MLRKTKQEKERYAEAEKLAHIAAKEWFRSRGVPHWTGEYFNQYPHFIRGYMNAWKREEKKRAKLGE